MTRVAQADTFIDTLKSIAESFLQAMDDFFSTIQNALQNACARIQEAVESVFSPAFRQKATHWVQVIEFHLSELDQSQKLLFEKNWPIPERADTAEVLHDLYLARTQPLLQDKLILAAYKRAYNEDVLAELEESWKSNPHLEKRLPILLEGLRAHRNQDYVSSVSVLLIQVEGLLCSVFPRTKVNAILKCALKSEDILKQHYAGILSKEVFSSFKPGDNQSRLNRHGIAHGVQTGYGTETNSLKTILLIDSTMSLFFRKPRLAPSAS